MRLILIFLLIWTASSRAQNINVLREYQIVDDAKYDFAFPQFNPDDSKIFFSRDNYKGIWYFDLRTNTLMQLNDHEGAGYEPVFSANGSEIIFRTFRFDGPRKKYSLRIQNIDSKLEKVLQRDKRNLSDPLVQGDKIIYRQNEVFNQVTDQSQNQLLKLENSDAPLAYSVNKKIIILTATDKQQLQPLGEVWYLWLSLSPDKTKMLFTVAGKGTFITDLNGKIMVEILPELHAPQWSPDGKWIVYMKDEDDGHTYTGSDLYVLDPLSLRRTALTTTTNRIEMHPHWSNSGKRIVYNTFDGKICLLDVETY